MTSSPGVVAPFYHHYPTREVYLAAIADAMRQEYRAIAQAGFTLQLDWPDFRADGSVKYQRSDLTTFRRQLVQGVEVLNHAVRDIPPEQLRLNLCWGNYEGLHYRDVTLKDTIDIILGARPAGISVKGCNARHLHELETSRMSSSPMTSI